MPVVGPPSVRLRTAVPAGAWYHRRMPSAAVNRLVPFAHVADVAASMSFYELLGFKAGSIMKEPSGKPFWALAASGRAEIMLARASAPVDHTQQAVLFYMYSPDVRALRERLLAAGIADGGEYRGGHGPNDGHSAVFTVVPRSHMPAGELRIHDPDGYVILVGQLE